MRNSKLINSGFPNTINEAKLNLRAANPYEKNENHDLCIQAAAKLGCSVVNIGGKDLLEGTPHLALGLMWQIIKKNLLALVAANLSKGEGFIDIPPEQMLFRWFNFHLANADSPRTLSNWSRDLQVRRECVLCVVRVVRGVMGRVACRAWRVDGPAALTYLPNSYMM